MRRSLWVAVALLTLAFASGNLWREKTASAAPTREAAGTGVAVPPAPLPPAGEIALPVPAPAEQAPVPAPPGAAGDDGLAPFPLKLGGMLSRYRIASTFLLPGEKLAIGVPAPAAAGRHLAAAAAAGSLSPAGDAAWTWRAPRRPGLYRLTVRDEASGEAIVLNAFVLTPYNGRDLFNGYRIGHYERLPLRDNPVYTRPQGLLAVTPELLDTPLSPHFRLRQFLCKQSSPFPKYLTLRAPLLLKLETLLARARQEGIEASTFTVMSGFRTPWYNAAIGNPTRYSRHGYGDAADIFVDEDGDGVMDDLNHDGRVDKDDARVLYDLVEEMRLAETHPELVGGLGLYGPNSHHGPFIHVDVRGFRARW
jgi:hypothetical protein